jgi:hypothetical protein
MFGEGHAVNTADDDFLFGPHRLRSTVTASKRFGFTILRKYERAPGVTGEDILASRHYELSEMRDAVLEVEIEHWRKRYPDNGIRSIEWSIPND